MGGCGTSCGKKKCYIAISLPESLSGANMPEPRYEFYETDERVTISIFDKGAVPEDVTIGFSPRRLTYEHGDNTLDLDPLVGEIDPDRSNFTIGKVKVEVRLHKKSPGRWIRLSGSTIDQSQATFPSTSATPNVPAQPRAQKNWEGIADEAIKGEPEKTLNDDPNAGGDAAVNTFFQKLFADADDDTKKAMMKSYQESGGTTLSTNWDEVGKKKVEVKPPEGSEWRKWG